MIAMCFDLSSTCIGITFAQFEKNKLTYVKTLPVIPERPSAKELGYTTQQPKHIEYNGNRFTGLLKPGEASIPKNRARKRIAEFKSFSHRSLLTNIGEQCGYFLDKVNPDVIAIERNMPFNGVLTTKLLAEIAGGLYFYAGAKDIPIYDFDVHVIRAKIRNDIKEFSRYKSDDYKMSVDTKWEIYCRLRSYYEKNHPDLINFENMTLDESDSLAVFYYLYTEALFKYSDRTV
jgi:hypothetical protein